MMRTVLRTVLVTVLVGTAACSDATAPCNDQGLGIPAFDLVGALRVRGAVVEELGERLDLTVFSVPTEVLRVNGEEILVWTYCIGGGEDHAKDIGLYGIGVFAEDPPLLELGPDEHMWTFAEWTAQYVGVDEGIIQLFEDVMGPELLPQPPAG